MRDGPRAATMMDLSSKEYAMRSYFAHGVVLALGVILAGSARMSVAQDFGTPTLLPIPTQSELFAASPVAHQDSVVLEAAPSDNPAAVDNLPSPSDAQVQAPSYKDAMQQWGSDSCTSGTCGDY